MHVALGEDCLALEAPHDAQKRFKTADYEETHISEIHPARNRRYFLDGKDTEWLLVQNPSDNPAERFSYS